jgi:ATP-dependent DNA ligase
LRRVGILRHTTKAPYPGFIEPALATSLDKAPRGERWLHEIEFDGYRVQLHLANNEIKVYIRCGNDHTKRFKKIADDAWHINAGSAIIDGEVVVPAADGATDFSVLQNELKDLSTTFVMVAFDPLYLNGYHLRKLPPFDRKAHLKKHRRHGCSVQRELRNRRPGDVRACLQSDVKPEVTWHRQVIAALHFKTSYIDQRADGRM